MGDRQGDGGQRFGEQKRGSVGEVARWCWSRVVKEVFERGQAALLPVRSLDEAAELSLGGR